MFFIFSHPLSCAGRSGEETVTGRGGTSREPPPPRQAPALPLVNDDRDHDLGPQERDPSGGGRGATAPFGRCRRARRDPVPRTGCGGDGARAPPRRNRGGGAARLGGG